MTMFQIEESLVTFSLRKKDLYMSAYQGFLIFGTLRENAYNETESFIFASYELLILYQMIVNIATFFASKDRISPKQIVKKYENIALAWSGKHENDTCEKLVTFYVEDKNESYCFEMEMIHIDTLVKATVKSYLSTLNLKKDQKFTLYVLIKYNPIQLQIIKESIHNFNDFMTKEHLNSNFNFEMNQLFLFYYDEIELLSKLHLLN